jgi:hypothetical protein
MRNNLDIFQIPRMGEGLALKQRTLPRKKPNTIDLIIRITAAMAFVFLTPHPIRKVCPDAILLRANRGIKPLVTLSFMDYKAEVDSECRISKSGPDIK